MSEHVEVRIIDAEALHVGPDEVLVVTISDLASDALEGFIRAFEDVGLGGRVLIIAGMDAKLAVAPKGN